MATAFISYAREDVTSAREVYDMITSNGHSAWLDEKSLLPGQNWKTEIHQAIGTSDFFIACLSSRSVSKKGYVQKELKTACEAFDEFPDHEIFIIPIRLDPCPIPQRFHELHCLDWYDKQSRNMLLDSLALKSGTASMPVEEFEILQALLALRSKTHYVFPELLAAVHTGRTHTDGSKLLCSTLQEINPVLEMLKTKGLLDFSLASDRGDPLPLDPGSMKKVETIFLKDINTARLVPLLKVIGH